MNKTNSKVSYMRPIISTLGSVVVLAVVFMIANPVAHASTYNSHTNNRNDSHNYNYNNYNYNNDHSRYSQPAPYWPTPAPVQPPRPAPRPEPYFNDYHAAPMMPYWPSPQPSYNNYYGRSSYSYGYSYYSPY